MLYSEIKELFNNLDADRELVELVINNLNADDFSDNNYRFIKEDCILDAVKNMYEGDVYMLGCFNADFIADITSLSYDIVTALQSADKFEAIGQHIEDNGDLDNMMEEYLRLDGVGNALSSYDGNFEEIEINNTDYVYFRI